MIRPSRPTEATDPAEVVSPFRAIPSVASLLADPRIRTATTLDDSLVTSVVRSALEQARLDISNGAPVGRNELEARVLAELTRLEEVSLQPILNGTGVIVHTNLGRSPVSHETAAAMAAAAVGNVALEIDPESGRRGGRGREISRLMRLLTGAEATLVVNNNAAAVLLTLAAIGAGREIVVSRGEAIEIGGGFRIPDVMRQSGAELVEVGTTNRTYARDYEQAISDRTAAFLKVHPSNFSVVGFTASAGVAELAAIGKASQIPVIEDLGSGALLNTRDFGLAAEPMISESLAAGASVVTASGDKLLGGPQAGIIAGAARWIEQIAAHPLARAVRADKTCLAGVAATLRHYARGEAIEKVPVWRMISASRSSLADRAAIIHSNLVESGIAASLADVESTVGGGSLPGQTLPGTALAFSAAVGDVTELARRLRLGSLPIYGRIESDRLLIDFRTIMPEDDARLLDTLRSVLSGARQTT